MGQVAQLLFITQHVRCMMHNYLGLVLLLPFGRPSSGDQAHTAASLHTTQPPFTPLSKLPHTVHCSCNQAWSHPSVVLTELHCSSIMAHVQLPLVGASPGS